MSVPEDAVQALIEQGVEIPDDPLEIEQLLLDQEGNDPDLDPEPEPKPDEEKPDDDKPSDEQVDDKPGDKPDEKDTPDEQHANEPPAAVLRATRESLHQTTGLLKERDEELVTRNARIDQLEGRIAQLTAASETDQQTLEAKVEEETGVKLEDLTPERIAEIREEAGDEAADLLEGLVARSKVLDDRLQELEESGKAAIEQREALEGQQLQNDIDSVPLLSVLHAQVGEEADANWARAVGYEKAIRQDPDWADKPRSEVYVEVGKRMAGHLGEDTVKGLLGDTATTTETDKTGDKSTEEKVDEALQHADDSAIPTSLSDLPAGQAAVQGEQERANAMSLADAEAALDKAYEKGGSDEVDILLNRLMTMENPP